MDVTFVKRAGAADRIYVRRDDGTEATWTFPSYGDGLPHDLAHFVVETELGLDRGVWGLVARGMDLERVNAATNQGGGKFYDRMAKAVGAEMDQVVLSETVVNTINAVDAPVPDGLSTEDATRLRTALADMHGRWTALGPSGSLRLTFPR